jgi:hypothetical protein
MDSLSLAGFHLRNDSMQVLGTADCLDVDSTHMQGIDIRGEVGSGGGGR